VTETMLFIILSMKIVFLSQKRY